MLIGLLVATILMSGGSKMPFTETLQAATHEVKKAVPEGAARERALAILKEVEKAAKEEQKEMKELEKEIGKIAARREATSRDFEAAFGRFDSRKAPVEAKIAALRFQLKDALSREEWAKVFPPPPPDGAASR